MDVPPKPIETKTTPFAVPNATTSALQMRNVKTLKYRPARRLNYFHLFVGVFMVFATGALVYVLLSLSQLQKLAGLNAIVNTNTNTDNTVNNTTTNTTNNTTNNTTVPVNDTETLWAQREIKINNNIVWKLQLPSSFIEVKSDSEGVNIFTGSDAGETYRAVLIFPLFTSYPDGQPENLKAWISKELTFLNPEDSINVTSESFTLSGNVDATILYNYPEITSDSGNARIFGSKMSAVLYISKTKTRNYSKIMLVPQGTYSPETVKAMIERIASSIKF